MTLLIVLVVLVIWVGSGVVMAIALGRAAKQGDRQTIVDDSPQLDTPTQRMVRP